jgi:hypothetical protein
LLQAEIMKVNDLQQLPGDHESPQDQDRDEDVTTLWALGQRMSMKLLSIIEEEAGDFVKGQHRLFK